MLLSWRLPYKYYTSQQKACTTSARMPGKFLQKLRKWPITMRHASHYCTILPYIFVTFHKGN